MDEHGCNAAAGYMWSEVKKDCIRIFETGIRMNSQTDKNATSSAFLVFSPDSLQVELFLPEEDIQPVLDRRSLPKGGYAWNQEDDDTYNGFQYFKMGDGVSIDGYIGDETELVIPEEIDGMKVTCIGENAFWGKSDLTSITIPESVIWIRDHAFSECKGITSIIIPANVDRIDFGVFSGCDKLENITVSKENKYYDSRYNCNDHKTDNRNQDFSAHSAL